MHSVHQYLSDNQYTQRQFQFVLKSFGQDLKVTAQKKGIYMI